MTDKRDPLYVFAMMGPSPCDKCELRTTCLRDKVACMSYLSFINHGTPTTRTKSVTMVRNRSIYGNNDHIPSRVVYQRIYHEVEQ